MLYSSSQGEKFVLYWPLCALLEAGAAEAPLEMLAAAQPLEEYGVGGR